MLSVVDILLRSPRRQARKDRQEKTELMKWIREELTQRRKGIVSLSFVLCHVFIRYTMRCFFHYD